MAIGELLEILQRKDGLADLRQRLHEGAVHEGLKHLALVLAQGANGTPGLSSWSSLQIQGTVSVTQAVVASCCSLRDDDEKSLVVRIFELAVEFCLCYLENNALVWPVSDEQASLLVLLEMTVIDGKAREAASTLRPLQNLQEFVTLAYSDSLSEKLSKTIEYIPQGFMIPKEGKSMGKVISLLANESTLFDGEQPTDLQETSFWKANSNMISISQHHAVTHLGCMVRMLVLCRELMHSFEIVEENSDEKVLSRIMLITKLMKVLLFLAKATTFTVSSNQLLVNISEVADLLPGVFKLKFESSSCDLINTENNLDHLLPLMLETFFQFVHSVVLDDNIFENIQTFIIAALLDILDGGIWRFDRQNPVQKLPLVYKPQVFIKILRFIRDVRSQSHRNIYWKETNHGDQSGDIERADAISVGLCCHLRSESFSLIGERSKDEQLNVIFSSAAPWLDNLVSLASFLHFQGVKPRPKGDKSWSLCSKDGAAVNDAESASGHEDDALFGDLFSEASKQVVCDGHEQSCSTNETLSDCSNMPLHGATEVLRFLKECIFSREWHSSIFERAHHQLTKEHVSVLLSLLQSQGAASDGRIEGSDPSEISFQRHLVGHFYKACFDLLHELVIRHSLSNELEEHLVDQVLKVEDGRYVYTDDALALLAHILIIRASKRSSLGEDPLRLKICKGYVDFIAEKVKVLYTRCLNIREVSASLPYLFHLEILLMVYQLSSACEKTKMAEITFLALSNVSSPPAEFNNTQLACWSLLVSRLMLVIRHMIHYFTTFPSWLMLHMRNKLRQGSQGEDLHLFKGVGHLGLESWVYHVVQNVINLNEGISGEQVMDDLSFQLIDVSGICNSSIIEHNALKDLGLDWTDLYSVISCILEAWQGKTPSQVEELILERYCFILGWSTLSDVGFEEASVLPWKVEPEGKLLGTECFIHFSRILRNNINMAHCGELSQLKSFLLEVLSTQQMMHKQGNLNEKGWVFLRHGAWLSLVISLLEAGLWKVSLGKCDVSRDDTAWIEQTSKDTAFLTLCEQFISHILEEGQTSFVLNILTSFLSMYVEALQDAALVVVDGKQCENDTQFSINLLLKSGLDKSKEEALLEKLGARFELIKSIYVTVSSLARIVNQENTGNLNIFFLRSLLHGFPSHGHPGSAVLVSAILSVEGILDTIKEFLRTRDALGEAGMELEVLNSLINVTMVMKFDRRFEGMHDKCEAFLNYLIPKIEERHIYTDLFVIKHMEGLVNEMNSKDIYLAVQENVITNAVDTVECFRVDPSKLDVLKYYLGHAGESNMLNQLKLRNFLGEHGNLLALVDSLDGCHSESVNVKVLQLFVNFLTDDPSYSNIKQDLQQKFLLMDLPTLAEWLEKRLLGYTIISSSGIASTHAIANSVRDSAIAFINALLLPSSHLKSRELLDHFLDAMLIGLAKAFMSFDILSAKAYFNYLVQLANGESAMKHVVKGAINIMVKLSACEIQLEGLKFIFGFLISALAACGANRHVLEKSTEKPWSNTSCSSGSAISKLKSNVTKKNTDALVNPINQGAQSAAMECDATSADEDEDDGTSDGELASMDKEDDDDSNSERSLASKVCTFTSSGSNFMEQHWYFCYTCDLTVSKGCCSVCARVCHRGHRVVYSRLSRFFCDCGAGGVRGTSCLCLKPRKYVSSSTVSSRGASSVTVEPFLPLAEDRDHLQPSDSDTDFDDDGFMDNEKAFKLSIPKEEEERVLSLFTDLDIEDRVLSLCRQLLPCLSVSCESVLPNDQRIVLGQDKVLSYNQDLLQPKKTYKSGTFEMKIKAEYSNARELKSHLSSGSLVKSLLSISSRGRLAVGEGDKVTILDVGQLIGEPTGASVTVDKTTVKHLSKNAVRFELAHLVFNSATENYLAVAGYEECQVLTINSRGEVTDRLAIELALQGAYIRRVAWIPGSQVQLMVVTNKFVKVYDLSQDNISPMHYFTLLEESIVDAELVPISQGRLVLLVLSQHGVLYRQLIEVGGCTGAQVLMDTIQLKDKDVQSKGISLYFSSAYRLIFISYQDGSTLIGRLNPEAMTIMEVSSVLEDDQDGKLKPAGLHHWKELLNGSGYFVCLSTLKSNAPLAVSVGPTELCAQQLRLSGNLSSFWVGVAAYRPLSKDKSSILVLHDDGSLQIFSFGDIGTWGSELTHSSIISPEQVRKLGSGILNNRLNAGVNPEFPLDFFEKTTCITADIKLGGDVIRNSDSEAAKLNLASDDGFLEGPSTSGYKVTVYNSNPDIVMVGCRVQVGNTSASHIPRELGIFQRTVKLEEGMRCWYDMPFTNAEALLADEEFTLTIGPTFNGSSLPRIDSLEVYGRAKDDFGWKEKVDAVLDIDTQTLSGASGSIAGRKQRSMQSASIQEQVVTDGLKLLSAYYNLYRLQSVISVESGLESSKINSQPLLEVIFQTDRQQMLQSAGRQVLQALYPVKETYYQVKDMMRLSGVLQTCPVLTCKIGIGGATTAWVIQEFAAQMRAVCKIALHRRPNLAAFLESNGSAVVDGLMEILWRILELEQPDTQTINNIVIPAVDLIYSYAECLALHGNDSAATCSTVAPAVVLLKRLLFAPYEAVQTSCSLAMSSRLLQVPFPKQTMLATDDMTENNRSLPVPSDTSGATGGSGQGMIEEDTNTSSVQYCCDGCSTVPILRRRWHCNVCPDFDLCEACYEVMDSDRLPQPHSRDHPMSAIIIEVDSVAADGSEIQFSMDEMSEESLLQVATEISLHNSPPLDPPMETNESRDFLVTANDTKVVALSAAKRAVNSLLLSELMEEIKGWMKSTPGSRAIPLMQLFYRLASAVGGPFMENLTPESLDLERFVKMLLDELNLSTHFVAKTRSFFGEVLILIFMFFTLMLRNWHQPASDQSLSKPGAVTDSQDSVIVQGTPPSSGMGSPSSNDDPEKSEFASQLDRACTVLRQQNFVNYLMDILQQLVHVYKTPRNLESGPTVTSGAACGALLTVRREFPAGNFVPYFSDSYAKAHRNDLFVDFHRLLLENTFRLLYNLIRPEKPDRPTERADFAYKGSVNRDLKLDGWQEVLCSYISNPHTSFVRRYARRLFLHLCGSRSHYYNVRDSWQISREFKRIHKLVKKSGGFQTSVAYERSVKLVKCLSAISEVASARPRNWQRYCSRHIDALQFLLNGVFFFGEESVLQTLKLLTLSFYTGKELGHSHQKLEVSEEITTSNKSVSQASDGKKKKKGDEGTDTSTEKASLDMEQAVEQFAADDGKVLRRFIDSFLLEWNSTSIRVEAKSVLLGTWHHGKQLFRGLLLTSLLDKVSVLPSYGQNIVEYTELLTWLLGKGTQEHSGNSQEAELVRASLSGGVVKSIFDTLRSQNELLANHPNCRIYNTLSSLVEFDGYYLESEPCVTCSCPEVPYSRMKLDSLKSETKFTDNRIIVKCTGSHTIQSVTMNVHDPRRSKSVKILNLYYNNRPVADLSELKNNWSLWIRGKSCHLAFNQTELKVEFPIPITACNFMIELDSFYENLQASSLESLQCPRCSRYVTDKHGICGNCHENAYQCRQCRNINYENLDSFLCNECGYSKYGRFEFTFMAKPSFTFDNMENDEDMKKGLAAIEAESENAHRRYQQLLGFKKPLLKLVSSIGEPEMDSQQKDSVQQLMVSLPGSSSFKINRKIALLGVLYGEKCKAAFDSVSRSVQTLQGLRRVLMNYLEQKHSDNAVTSSRYLSVRPPNRCYGCATTFVTQCLELLQVLSKHPHCKQQLVTAGILSELFENNIHQGPKSARLQARSVLCSFSQGDANAVAELNTLIKKKVTYCLEHHRSMDIAACIREELQLLSESCSVSDELWEARLRIAFHLLFSSVKVGARHPAIAEHIILPCLRIISHACTPPKTESSNKEMVSVKSGVNVEVRNDVTDKNASSPLNSNINGVKTQAGLSERDLERDTRSRDVQLLNYAEWEKGASYLDFVRRQYKVSQSMKMPFHKSRRDSKRSDYLSLKYGLRWKRRACMASLTNEFSAFEQSSWVSELVLSACSQSIRSEMCGLISVLCASSARRSRFLNLLMTLLPATKSVGESAAELFELLFKMVEPEDARLYLTVRGFISTICRLITEEVARIEAQERSFHMDISQGFILHKLIELLSKFLEVPNIRSRFMKDKFLSQILEALLVTRGLIVQKTKLISDCNRLLRELLDCLLNESDENKRHFIWACISGLQIHGEERKGRAILFILEQLCNIICPSKPEPVYLLILSKAHTQEEFIRGSMTKNPYSSAEIGPLMRDVKNKICHQLDLLGLLEDDYGMELLVAGNIISLDLSIAQVYEQVWRKTHNHATNNVTGSGVLSVSGAATSRDCPPMTVTYRLQGLDGEATEPMIKELEEDREISQDPEIEFAIAGAVRECGGLNIILNMVQHLRDDELKSNQEELALVLKLLMYCCKIRENRQALLRLGALALLLETARRAFSVDAVEPAEGILLIVESLVMEANDSDIGITESALTTSSDANCAGEQAARVVMMFLERLCHPSGLKKSTKQQRNNEMVARILPYLTYGEQAAMEVLVDHFNPYLKDWVAFDDVQVRHQENVKDEGLAQQAAEQRFAVENFVKVSESIKINSFGEKLKDIIIEKGIARVAVQHLKEVFGVFERGDFKSTPEWIHALKLPSVPVILSMLRGLARGHIAMQQCIDGGGVLPLLHALEGVPGENEIGARAENLLDTFSDKDNKGEGFLADKVHKLRHATKDEMRRRALRRREELLQGLGMRRELASDGGERIVVSQPVIEGLEEVEEEEAGLACMVCREGYSLRPTDMLGAYSFSKRVHLGIGTTSHPRGEWVYTTVSHFNIIHFQCHQEAKRADASLKNPKKEWEGAALRNNETLCNSLFPLRGPAVPLTQYARHVDQYWDSLNALGRTDGSRIRLLTYDIVLMLARFATGASFSTDSKGGGKESNSRFLPFMIQMANHLLDQGGTNQRRSMAKNLITYLTSPSQLDSPSGPKPSTPPSQRYGAAEETVQFMMVHSLLLQSLDEWEQHRHSFLQRGIYHAYMQYKHGHSPLTAPASSRASSSDLVAMDPKFDEISKEDANSTETGSEKLFAIVQPMLIYTGLVEQLQRFLKLNKPSAWKNRNLGTEIISNEKTNDDSSGSLGMELWEVTMRERLQDVKGMLGFSKELLNWLEDMQSASDMQEAFDIMGALSDALSGGFSRCEDFVQDAISNGNAR